MRTESTINNTRHFYIGKSLRNLHALQKICLPANRRLLLVQPIIHYCLLYVSLYVLLAIARKRLGVEASLCQILQILSVTLFEKKPILRTHQSIDAHSELCDYGNQLNLFSL